MTEDVIPLLSHFKTYTILLQVNYPKRRCEMIVSWVFRRDEEVYRIILPRVRPLDWGQDLRVRDDPS